MFVSEIPVSNTVLTAFMKQSSAGSVTEGQRIGYVRVSTVAQTLNQQNEALESAGVTKTFSDTMSGARDDRPGLAALMDYVREGDTVVVWKLDAHATHQRLPLVGFHGSPISPSPSTGGW
jgi:Resolvase, N terminal domain